MKIVSPEIMSHIDRETMKYRNISSKNLMGEAGNKIGEIIIDYINTNTIEQKHVKRFVTIIGSGNNGGDAVVVANYLSKNTNKDIIIYSMYDTNELNDNTKYYLQLLSSKVEIKVLDELTTNQFEMGDIIIDGILGTGFTDRLKSKYINWIKKINDSGLPVISIDVPSGLNGETGIVQDVAVISDLTVTIGLPKIGLIINDGLKYVGRLEIANINIPEEIVKNIECEYSMFTQIDAYKLIKRVPINSNKKTTGKVLIIGGSNSYTNAPFISANAALRAGAGFVTVAVPQKVKPNFDVSSSIIVRKINDDENGYFCESSIREIKELINYHDTLVVGPGMSNNRKCIPVLKEILEYKKKTVIDADAINLLSIDPSIMIECDNFIYTPHSEEMNRLLISLNLSEYVKLDRIERGKVLSEKTLGIVVAKGNKTAIISKNIIPSINSSGSQALAKAGSGDALSGIIGAFTSLESNDIYNMVCLSVYIHGLTASLSDNGFRGLTSDDIIRLIPKAIKNISPFG